MENKIIGFKQCKRGHLLGQMRINGSGNEILELFRQAIDYGTDMPEQVDVIGIFTAGQNIRCSICEEVVDFHRASRSRHAPHIAFE